MALMAVLESDLRALSAEARRRYPAVKDGAEHAILKLRSLSSPSELAQSEDILRIFLMACEVRTVKLSVIGLSCIQKLISHDAVAPSALKEIFSMLKNHADMVDESVQLKTLQTILIIFQSRLHPENEDNMAQALGICLRLLENNRSSDSVRNTAAATFRQAVALIFDHVVRAESLPLGKFGSGAHITRTNSVTGDVSRSINHSESLEHEFASEGPSLRRETLTKAGKLGLRLLEDLTALAAGGSIKNSYRTTFKAMRVYFSVITAMAGAMKFSRMSVFFVHSVQSCFSFQDVLRHQICSLLMTSLRTNVENEGETGEPYFRRLVLRSVAHIIRLYSSSLITECEVFLSMLVKVTFLDLPLWHRILVLEILRGFCVEARTLRLLFQNFDMNPKNTNVVEGMVKALARVVSSVQFQETSEESLSAVAGMFSSKAKGIEWILDNDASNAAVLVASEAHSITLAIEGLLGVVFTVATLTDEAVDVGELESPRCDYDPLPKCMGETAVLCISMVDSLWLTILDALSLILSRSQGEAIILEILKGYQAFTQACGVLHAVEPLNSFLASLCKFTINIPNESDRRSAVLQSPGSKRSESLVDQKDNIVLTPKNVQALRTLFNIAHRLHNVLGPSWVLVLETLAALDRAIHSPHATTQEVSTASSKLARESSGQYSDFNVLSSLNSQFLLQLADNSNQHLRNIALDALDQSICAVLGSEKFQDSASRQRGTSDEVESRQGDLRSLECAVISPLRVLYFSTQSTDVRAGTLKILLHVLERCGEKLHYSWPSILELLRSVADASEKDLITLGFQSLRFIMNDGLSSIPTDCIHECVDVTGAYSSQKTELNISLTAVGLLWTTTDFIAKGLDHGISEEKEAANQDLCSVPKQMDGEKREEKTLSNLDDQNHSIGMVDRDKLLFAVFSLLKKLGADQRPEVRNSAIRTLFQTLGSHGQKLSESMWEDCLWNYVFPMLDCASHMAATSSKDEWQGKELGTRGGKAVHMLIHHSRNTAQKQWDETLVLVLGGIARLLRSFFPFLANLSNFWTGWESLLHFVKNSILNGSKEVSLAAINCLQTTVLSHSTKGNLPVAYLNSVLDVYEYALQKSPNYSDNAAGKVKQEILHGLGELYLQAQKMFDDRMYGQLLAIIDLAVRQTMITHDNYEIEFGHVPPVLRTILEILPLLSPTEQLCSMWLVLLREILQYLPRSDSPLQKKEDEEEPPSTSDNIHDVHVRTKYDKPNGTAPTTPKDASALSESSGSVTAAIPNHLFAEKLIPVLVDLFLTTPAVEKCIIFPEIIQNLGRCMTTRRDNPDSSLWRLAVEGFNHILVDDVTKLAANFWQDMKISRPARLRVWKEVADVYEIFLVGYCGRALPSNSLSAVALSGADESLEMSILDILGDKILKSPIDAPFDVLQRLISTIDRCASRTCSLPVETVELMPAHCSKFSLACLHKLFSLSSSDNEASKWNLTRAEVSKISITVLMGRCEYILNRFLIDENDLGERNLPAARLEEIIFILQELARLKIHPDTASALPLHPVLKSGLAMDENSDKRPHLLVLFPSFCELVISSHCLLHIMLGSRQCVSKEARVRELVQVLLRLITKELALEKASMAGGR
ncbi:ARM repeat superfamily protein [Citrus sinensis]|uniref:ARM repeat superfamily protein n=1 Tax=Citrus sinensis TaxID=2711 RepID=A0ACB8KIT5_CITSI|nr:ARM repeat superfamily protein [Citrus sinensis]